MQQLILHLDSETPPRDQDKAASASVSIVLITSSITRDTPHVADAASPAVRLTRPRCSRRRARIYLCVGNFAIGRLIRHGTNEACIPPYVHAWSIHYNIAFVALARRTWSLIIRC